MYISELQIEDYSPFTNAFFKFERVNVVIGQNGTGKSRLLSIISALIDKHTLFLPGEYVRANIDWSPIVCTQTTSQTTPQTPPIDPRSVFEPTGYQYPLPSSDIALRRITSQVEDSAGIVLIDGIEKSLDSRRQQIVLPTLTSLYLKHQFIVTTHSPIVVNSVTAKLFSIENGTARIIDQAYGQLADMIYTKVFNLPSTRPAEVQDQVNKMVMAVRNNSQEARRGVQDLQTLLGNDPVVEYAARLLDK